MLQSVDEDEKTKIFYPANIMSGVLQANTEYWFLTEDGLYEVLMQSRKPKAKEFKKEVKKILKSIRKTGGYVVGQENMQIQYTLEITKHYVDFSTRERKILTFQFCQNHAHIQIQVIIQGMKLTILEISDIHYT